MSVQSLHRFAAETLATQGRLDTAAVHEMTERGGPLGRWVDREEVDAVRKLAARAKRGEIAADPVAIDAMDAFVARGADGALRRGFSATLRAAGYTGLGAMGTILGLIGIGGAIGATTITLGTGPFAVILAACAFGGARSSLKED